MSFRYGFYNAINGDRAYDATDMSALFDGIINDGVFASYGQAFKTVPGQGLGVVVKPGRAWFDHTWSWLDSDYPLEIGSASALYERIDAIIIETNSENRSNQIRVISGTPETNAQKPTLLANQHALSYVHVLPGATSINQENIEYAIGRTGAPFVTGVLSVIDAENITAQWEAQFNTWFANLHYVLDGDVAGHLQDEIDTVQTLAEDSKWNLCDVKQSYRKTLGDKWLIANGEDVESADYPEFAKYWSSEIDPTRWYTDTTIYDGSSDLSGKVIENIAVNIDPEIDEIYIGYGYAAHNNDITIGVVVKSGNNYILDPNRRATISMSQGRENIYIRDMTHYGGISEALYVTITEHCTGFSDKIKTHVYDPSTMSLKYSYDFSAAHSSYTNAEYPIVNGMLEAIHYIGCDQGIPNWNVVSYKEIYDITNVQTISSLCPNIRYLMPCIRHGYAEKIGSKIVVVGCENSTVTTVQGDPKIYYALFYDWGTSLELAQEGILCTYSDFGDLDSLNGYSTINFAVSGNYLMLNVIPKYVSVDTYYKCNASILFKYNSSNETLERVDFNKDSVKSSFWTGTVLFDIRAANTVIFDTWFEYNGCKYEHNGIVEDGVVKRIMPDITTEGYGFVKGTDIYSKGERSIIKTPALNYKVYLPNPSITGDFVSVTDQPKTFIKVKE